MISPDSPLGLPVEAPFNSDPLKKLISGSEEGPLPDDYDPTPTGGDNSEVVLPSIEETPVEDLLLVEGGEKIDARRLAESEKASATLRDRDPQKGDPLTGETPTEELIEDTLRSGRTKNSPTPAPIQTRTNKQKPNIFKSGKTDPLINPKKDKATPNPGKQKKEDENYLNISFDSGIFEVGKPGKIDADFLYDGGVHKSELAIFSIEGFEEKHIRSYEELVKEAASRALSNSELGHVIISDKFEGARFDFPLGEKSRNGGKYLGHKTKKMNPGDKFALMLVPKSTVEKVFQNPKQRGAKNPLFSFSTHIPDDLFWPGQLGQVNDKGGIYAWEDSRLDGKSDLDYNDIIFCLTGAKGDVSHLDDLINPKKDWRESKNAPQILEQICHGSDLEPPIISAELVNDTGSDDTDKITSDPAISGTVTDDNYLKTFAAGFEETSLEFELIAEIDELGNFQLSSELLEEIKGEKLQDGTHTLYLQATDYYDNSSAIYEFSFILDTATELTLELDSEFDSLPEKDNITNFETVTLSGKTEANATVTLDETGETVIADESGNFEFVEVELELGENTFNATVEDVAGNEESISLTLERIKKDTEPPAISVELANDTGSDDADKITSDPTIYGTITEENELETFLVGFDESTLEFELTNSLDEEGIFELSLELLEEIKGEKLEDGTHTLYLKAADNFENESDISEFYFTLDTGTELTFELDKNFDSPPTGDGITEEEIVSLIGRTEPNQIVTLNETGKTVTADDEGNFEFAEVEFELGENTFNATVEDAAGNRESVEITITRDEIILIENEDFKVTKIKTVEIPETSSQIKINIADIAFDIADEKGINDAFELALVDSDGNSLVHTIENQRDSFFNFTEGETPTLAAGVDFDGSTVTVDLSQLTPGIEATLLGRLVNNDDDTETAVRIREINIEPAASDTPPISTSELSEVPAAREIDFDRFSDVSGMVETKYLQTSFNEETDILYVDLEVESSVEYPLRGGLLVAISNISDPSVRVIDADGTTSEGLSFYDLTDGESSTLAFYNPLGVQFDRELVFLGQSNSSPEFVSDADVEAIVGKFYIYDALAVDRDGDELSYFLLEGPAGMSVDAETGEVAWEPTVEDVGSHGVRVKVSDEFGGVDEQGFVLSVVEGKPNRSSVWGSLPVVDASVNGDYVYEAFALDADGDVLSYSLVEGPEGMEVDADGVVSWLPSGEQIGLQLVVLKVEDGNGGEALQEFGILVRQEVGNIAPIIVSEAETEISVPLSDSPWEDLVFGIKSHGVAGEPHPSKVPAHLFSFPTDASEFTDIGSLTLDGEQIDADGLAISRKYGLLAFKSAPNDSTLISIDPDTAVARIVGEPLVGREIRGAVEDRDDNLWVLDSDNEELLKIDPEAGTVLESTTLTLEGEQFNISDTTDIAISPDGTFYVVSNYKEGSWDSGFFTLEPETGVLSYEAIDRNQFLSGLTFSGTADENKLFAYDVLWDEDIHIYDLDDSYARSVPFLNIIPSFNAGRGDLAALVPPVAEYQYSVEAIDPSEDALVYSLETAPDSMAIDPNTGEIVWNPTAEELYQVPEDGSGPMTFFGEDISNLGDSSRLSATPNADSARDDFLSKLVGVETEDFESFAHGERPSSLTFGTDTADFLGNPYVINIANGTYNGTFPTSGDKLLLQQPGAGPFEIEFSYPQAAFGFYATDVGDAGSKLVVELYHSDGEITEIYAPQELTVTPTGSALYFGVIDVENPLTKVKLTNDNDSAEGFGFDDMTIGRLEQVSIPPVDVTVRVSDGRGGVDTQSFQIEVKEPLGEIQGTIWNDVSGEGLREDSETGLSGVEVYLDLNENGELDPDEPTTLTDSRGEYRFSDLTAGKYVVREVLPEGLEYTFPDATPLLGPNLLKNGSFEDGPRDFSGSYKTLYDGSTEINNWNVGGEVDYMFGPYQLTPEQFASVERTSDGEIALDLVGIQPGSLSQTFETVPGKDYLVTFDLSANPGIKAGVGVVMEVKAAEQSGLFVGVSTGSYNSMEYQTHSWEFTANSELTTLELLAETYFPAAGPFVDNVSVSEVTPDIKQIVSLGAGQTVKNIDFGNTKLDPAVKNSPPTFTSTNTTDTATVGELWSYQATATDPDFDPLTYFLIAKPDGMTVNPETGLVVWKPTYEQINETLVDTFGGEQPGIYNLVIGAKDGNGGIDVQSFEVEVIATDKPVIVSGDALAPAAVGKPYEYRFHAQNADGTTLTYRLDTQLEGMSLDETTGVLTWTPTDSQLGEQLVTVAVIDAETGDETSRDFNFTVVANAPNSPPTITSTPRQRVRIGDNYLYTVDATDPNNDPLTYVLETAPFGMRIGVDGRIFWQPTSADAGINAISIVVSDSRGGEVKQEYELAVTSTGENRPPSITSTPKGAATIAQQYEYNLTGSDPDGDEYWWSLDTAPQGMSIDPEAGTIRWEPNVSQVGSHEVAVRLTDANGAFVGQAFSISVRGVNVPPVITSTPLTEAVASKSYNYVVQAEDVEGDALTFSLVNPRSGMTVDGDTGLIEWIPLAVGEIDVEVVVEDALGAVARQTYQIAVSETAANLPPTITSAPVSFASIGKKYEYEVTAADPDGDDVTYQLLEVPDETMTVSDTGLIEWVPTTEGVYTVAVGAVDRFGLGGAQRFTVDVALAVEPIVASTPVSSVTAGAVYRYQINATSVKGERISYSLESAPEGMSVDEFGRVVWMPDSGDIGSYDVAISIYDPRGNSVLQSFELTVEADREAPKVSLFVSNERVGLDETVNFVVNAVDDVGVEEIGLIVDGVPVAVDANGRASVVMGEVGDVEVVATAVDAAGNFASASRLVSVLGGSSDGSPPLAILDDSISDSPITSLSNVLGTVTDDGAVEYVLEVAPVAGGEFVEVASGSTAVENGKLGSFDPSVLQNDSYVLRLTATDGGGNSSRDSVVVDVAGDLKLGNFRLSFTDLEIPLSGIPISVVRTYDSLNASERDDFGYGWRLEFRDTDLRTSVRKQTTEEELLGVQSAFADGERVYVTLPGGERTGFTFEPRGSHLNGYLSYPEAFMYHPEFVADDGSELTLRVKDVNLVRKAGTDEYVENGSGVPYNPADPRFGGVYELVTKEGVLYTIDAVSGDLLTVTDRNENKLTFSDAGIVSSTGVAVSFERDAALRIVGVVDPEGNRIGYEYDEFGDLVGVTDREDNTTEFVYDADDRPHYLEEIIDPLGRSGVKTEYDDKGRLQRMLDVNGEAVELVYDPDNSTQTVLDVFGNPTTYVYDERGNVVTEVDAVNKVVERTYDEDNNVLTLTVVTDESGPDGWTTSFTYDSSGNKLTETDPLGNTNRWTYNRFSQVLTETNPLGQTTSYTYDSNGNLLSTDSSIGIIKQTYDRFGNINAIIDAEGQETKFEYDSFGRVTRQIDALGNPTTYTYDANGKTLTETTTIATASGTRSLVKSWTYNAEGRVSSETDALGNITEYEYDKLGNMTAVIEKGTSDRRTEYRYDAKGQLEETVYADGTSARSVYDAAGREIATIDEKGQTTHFIYDALGRLVETIYPDSTPNDLSDNPRTKTEYDKIGRTKAYIDERGNRTEYEYDKAGRRTLVRDALNNETKYTYDAGGNRLTETDARNHTTKLVYDDLGRPAETHFADGSRTITTYNAVGLRSSFTDQTGNTTYFVYDPLERPTEVIHPDDTPNDLSNNPRTKTEYNELGWVTAEIDELGNRQEYEYDEKGRLIESRSDCACRRQTYTYDAFGNRISETDQLGHTTSFVYDELNRLIETHYHDGSSAITTYDELGRVKTQTDQAGKTTEFEYDALGRLTGVVDALGQRTEYGYDLAGNLIKAEDANQHVTEYEYDKLSRRTAIILPLGQRSETTYDPVGNIASTIDFNGNTITYEYDPLNRNIAKQFPDNTAVEYAYTPTGQIETVKDGRGITAYDYDVRSRLISQINPDNRFVRYRYDAASNRTAVITPTGTTEYTYDKYNQLETVTDPNLGVTRYTYDNAGNIVRTDQPNNTVEIRQYDDLNRLVFLENTGPSGTISSYRYTLDPVGNRLVVEEGDGRKVEYGYDDLYRLTREKITDPTGSDRAINYTYDAVGNRLSRNDFDGLTTYLYDDNDRLSSDGSNSYAYDDNGNTLSRTKDATDRAVYTWDYENRLVGAEITKPTGTVDVQYEYDPDGIRVGTIANGEETRYLVDRNRPHAQVLEEYAPDGAVQAFYVYGKDLISQSRDGTQSFYHVDGLGSTRALTNASGAVTDTYDYEAYGNLLDSAGNTVNNYRFTGEQFDPYLDDYYLRMRYYNPESGRFTTMDPFEGVLTEPLSRASYPYVHGNPVNAIDPSGMFLEYTAPSQTIASQMWGVLNSIHPAFLFAGASGTIGAVFAAHQAQLILSQSKIKECTLNGDEDCEAGIPIVFFGQTYNGEPLQNTTEHVKNAITDGKPAILSAWATKPVEFGTTRKWYKKKHECNNPARRRYVEAARSRGIIIDKDDLTCDEYPFYRSEQGGRENYSAGRVSLQLVPEIEAGPQGRLMGDTNLQNAGVVKGDFFLKWYGVVSIPELPTSFWKKRK